MKYAPYSLSKIRAFECPQKFYFRYVKGIPETKSDAARVGIEIHDSIAKHLCGEQKADKKYIGEAEAAAEYVGNRIVTRIESKFGITLEGKEVGFSDPEAFYRGIIDCVAEGELIDWKTGYSKEADHDQLLLYSYILESLGEAPSTATFYYIKDRSADTIEYEHKLGRAAYAKLIEKIEQIESCESFSPEPSNRCAYCGYRNICAADNLGYPDLKDEQSLLKTLEWIELEKLRIKGMEDAVKTFVMETGITCQNEKGLVYRPRTTSTIRISNNARMEELLKIRGNDPEEFKSWDTAKIKKALAGLPDVEKGVYKISKTVRVGWGAGDED